MPTKKDILPEHKALLEKYARKGKGKSLPEVIRRELGQLTWHTLPVISEGSSTFTNQFGEVFSAPISMYQYNDSTVVNDFVAMQVSFALKIQSLDELLDRDNQRQQDGFPRKIRVGQMVKPGFGGGDKVVVVPTTVEEKFLHDTIKEPQEEEEAGGAGEGEEGEVIGETPVRPEQTGEGTGPGQGEGGDHDVESSAYDLGRVLTEKFELPNLKDKGKKRSLTRYTYDLTDKNRGFGQVLDKKATLKNILETNLHLGRIDALDAIDPADMLISPHDKTYRVLSPEKDLESQALIIFIRDYSGSMGGKPTSQVVTQHVLIYSWLLFQYARQVETRFILHDTEAKEVKDFYTYYNSSVAGGTQVASAYRLVNQLVEELNLARDYNIYIFHGTDGDDWDTEGEETIPELKKMLTYSNRVGITIARNEYSRGRKSEIEKYLKKSGLLTDKPELIRLDVLQSDADEQRMIQGIKHLIS